MNERTMGSPGRLDAAAKAELDAIQCRLEATWDIEAGLREILLERHYHRFVEEQAGVLDVEAGLAEVLAGEAQGLDCEVWHVANIQQVASFVVKHCDVRVPAQPSTFDRVRLLARSMRDTFMTFMTTAQDEWEEWNNGGLMDAFREAYKSSDNLKDLAYELEHGLIELEKALQILRGVIGALMNFYDKLSSIWDPQTETRGHIIGSEVLELASGVNNLEQPIKRLFEPSDDVVDALR